jgi:hypothetical protein
MANYYDFLPDRSNLAVGRVTTKSGSKIGFYWLCKRRKL